MRCSKGLKIETIYHSSNAYKAGFKDGDILLSIDGNPIRDIIDILYYGNDNPKTALIKRDGQTFEIDLSYLYGLDKGVISKDIVFKHFKIKTCTNRCIFCFVSQLPKGLRKSLYIRDEDYRMSFLYGNYITLTNITKADKERIKAQKLSPLYISVHATDNDVRKILLGNKEAAPVLDEIAWFAKNKIRMHCQIVVCPGINDSIVLEKTIKDLYRYYPYVMSVAVVPLGITRYLKRKIRPFDKSIAVDTVKIIERLNNRFRKKHGEGFVYPADELLIKADYLIPEIEYYDDLHQIENGVGMIALFDSQTKKIKLKNALLHKNMANQKIITFSGASFYPFLKKFIIRLQENGINIDAYEVKNSFFGESVTVTGLLTGRDVIKTLSDKVTEDTTLLIPDVCLKEGDNIFLDDLSITDMEELLHVKVDIIDSTAMGIIEWINNH